VITCSCVSRFIEIECPLYVQPTLEGVHRGLKVNVVSLNPPLSSDPYILYSS
jgi:hypothetical protein